MCIFFYIKRFSIYIFGNVTIYGKKYNEFCWTMFKSFQHKFDGIVLFASKNFILSPHDFVKGN